MEYKPASLLKPNETPEQHKKRVKSELSTLHQHYKTLNSANLHAEFQDNPQEWHKYHAVSEQNEQSFPEHEIPRNRVIQELNKIKCKRAKTVVDMGCGKAHISQHFASDPRFRFINYDHVSCNSNVQQCDIANIPLEDDSVEICIMSLAMWGHNCKDYVKEAHRILETGGKLYIIEATKRWTTETDTVDPADRLKKLLTDSGFRIDTSSIRKFCLFECSK
jgi:ribosomal RNA-processing protein 8